MTDAKWPGGDSPYRGPKSAPPKRDKRQREHDRQREFGSAAPREPVAIAAPTVESTVEAPALVRAEREVRVYGLNACLALFAKRPQAVRKVWLLAARIPAMKAVLAHCVGQRLGYTVVEAADLEKLSGSAHHEGVVFGTMPQRELSLTNWLADLSPGPQLAIWLDGVGNPHNFGAMLRSAAHFGAAAALLPASSDLAFSGAAARVAEGGAEHVPLVRLGHEDEAVAQLNSAGFVLAATVARGGSSLYETRLPKRLVLLMGAEQTGISEGLLQRCELKLAIPGTGAVDSLNVASATSVLLSEWRRQQLAKR